MSSRRVEVGLLGAGLVAAALLAAGCGTGGVASASGGTPDTANGQTLFKSTCGSCHTLADAGTVGTIGPNLDNAFASDRTQGYAQSTIENVVLDQIRLGSGPIATYTQQVVGGKGITPQTPMPANLLKGQDAVDVAAYVASVAGTGASGTTNFKSLGTNGAAIFKGAGCAGCHTLAVAGSTGTTGPNLDQLASILTVAIVVKQVTAPPPGPMPSFKDTLTAAQIQAVAKYVASNAGK